MQRQYHFKIVWLLICKERAHQVILLCVSSVCGYAAVQNLEKLMYKNAETDLIYFALGNYHMYDYFASQVYLLC